MSSQEDNIELSKNKNDYVASALNSSLGAIPFTGPLLAEIAGEIIPNQRVDRIVEFAEILDSRLSKLEEEFVRSKLVNEYFTDLIEEGIRQASRAISEERKNYLASIIANSLSSEEISHIESKHLMRILGELNDIEVIWLKSYSVRYAKEHREFMDKHQDILNPVRVGMNSSRAERDQAALQKSYKEHLTQLGLLKYKFKQRTEGRNNKKPEFDNSGEQIKTGYRITDQGKLLLRKLDLIE